MLTKYLKSLTIQGAAVTGAGATGIGQPIALLLTFLGLPVEAQEVADVIDAVAVVVGIVMTVLGRRRAQGPLSE